MKNGKVHCDWNVVENRRLSDGRVVQRQVLYLDEINDSQRRAWRKTIEVFDEGTRRQVALFAEDAMPEDDAQVLGIRLNELQLKHPRQWGACGLSVMPRPHRTAFATSAAQPEQHAYLSRSIASRAHALAPLFGSLDRRCSESQRSADRTWQSLDPGTGYGAAQPSPHFMLSS